MTTKRRLGVGSAVALLVLSAGVALGQAPRPRVTAEARRQMQAVLRVKASWTPAQRKISSHLIFARKMHLGLPVARGVTTVRTGVDIDAGGRTLVDIRAAVTPALLIDIARHEGQIVASVPKYSAIRARIPIGAVEAIAALPGVRWIRPAGKARTQKTNTSEGDVAHGADLVRTTLGFDGTGVKIGVLSDSVDNLAAAQASGDLPPIVTVPAGESGTDQCPPNPTCSGEGTAMLEIVFDLAPGADLFFETAFRSAASMAVNIEHLRFTLGCDVIVDDIFYFNEPPFQPGVIEQAVDLVAADGALYFSSAGNDGNENDFTSGVWEGDYLDSGFDIGCCTPLSPDIAHDFGGFFCNDITKDPPFQINLWWSDPLGASVNDYDLWMFDSAGINILAMSINAQRGDIDPFESIDSSGVDHTGNLLVITKSFGPSHPDPLDRFLHLNTLGGELLFSTAGQTLGHAAAAGGFGVAAVDVAMASGGPFVGGPGTQVEDFSSDGPRRVFFDVLGNPLVPGDFSSTGGFLRQKPDIAGADGVSTVTPGFNPFFGTSAAAPHCAAVAGLVLEADPTQTPATMRTLFSTTALDIESPGLDRDSGFGICDALAAVTSVAGGECGNGVCVPPGEDCDSCPQDCGTCPTECHPDSPDCGDPVCDFCHDGDCPTSFIEDGDCDCCCQFPDTADCGGGGNDCPGEGDCDDGNPCTVDTCSNGTCQHNSNTSCGDGTCSSSCGENASNCCQDCAQCCNNGDCDDGNPCTVDTCSNGTCQHNSNTSCGDGTCSSSCGESPSNCCEDCCEPCSNEPYTIGGAVFSDCDDPLGSGEADIAVSVVCNNGFTCNTTTFGGQALWQCNGVPCDTCTVTVAGSCYLETGLCPPEPCNDSVEITVDDNHMAENQSLAFQRDCILYDMNGDGFVSILGDVPCFVDFVFFSIDQPNPVCAGEVPCACDGNQDGFCSIIGDVPGFVDCLFFNQCSEPANASVEAGDTARRGFTVGGAVYADRDNPLTSGVEGVAVELLDASGDSISSTTTGRFGIWKLEALPTGTYSVVFESVNGDGSLGMVSRTIAVAERNKVAMQSIQLHLPEESQRQEPQRRKVRRNSRR